MGPNSMGGKWFAESQVDAFAWGNLMVFEPDFVIVGIELSDEIANNLFRIEWLDNIGPARYATLNLTNSRTQSLLALKTLISYGKCPGKSRLVTSKPRRASGTS